MKERTKKLLVVLLAMMITFTMMPSMAFAAVETPDENESTSVELPGYIFEGTVDKDGRKWNSQYDVLYHEADKTYTYNGKKVNFINENTLQVQDEDTPRQIQNIEIVVSVEVIEQDSTVKVSLSGLKQPVSSISNIWKPDKTYVTYKLNYEEQKTSSLSGKLEIKNISVGEYTLTDGKIFENTVKSVSFPWPSNYSGIDFEDGKGNVHERYFGYLPDISFSVTGKKANDLDITAPTKCSYKEGEKLDLAGMKLHAQYGDGEKIEITKDFTTTPSSGSVLLKENDKVNVKWYDLEKSFNISVEPIRGLEISTNPEIVDYKAGQKLDLTGLKVNAIYDNNVKRVVNDYNVSVANGSKLKAGKTTVTVSYLEKTATFEVNAEPVPGIPEGQWVTVYDPQSAADMMDKINAQLLKIGQEEGLFDYSSVKKLRVSGTAATSNLFNYSISRDSLLYLEELDLSGLNVMPMIAHLSGEQFGKLKKVTASAKWKTVSSYVFSNLPELETIVLPNQDEEPMSINYNISSICPKVKEVFFENQSSPIGSYFVGANASMHTNLFIGVDEKPTAYVPEDGTGYNEEAFTKYFSEVKTYKKTEDKTLDELNQLIAATDNIIKSYEDPFAKLTNKWGNLVVQQKLANDIAERENPTTAEITSAWKNLNDAKNEMPFTFYAYMAIPKGAKITVGTKDEELSDVDNNWDWYYAQSFGRLEITKKGYGKYLSQETKGIGSVTKIALKTNEDVVDKGPADFELNANLYTNLDDTGAVNLKSGEKFDLKCIRVSQTVTGQTDNDAVEPEYYFELLGDSVEIEQHDNNRLRITALKPGTSIIKVTYSAFERPLKGFSYVPLPIENTGIVVVNVDGGVAFDMGMNVINDHDTFYFDENDGYRNFTFAPPDGSKVRVHDPLYMRAWGNGWRTYTENSKGDVTVHLRNGRNIIEVTDSNGNVQYQVVRAKAISVTRNGNNVTMVGIEEPVEKITGIYNPGYDESGEKNKTYLTYTNGSTKVNSNTAAQYREITTKFTLSIPQDGVWTGKIYSGWFGAPAKAHRTLDDYGSSMAPEYIGLFGSLPEFGVELAPEIPLDNGDVPSTAELLNIKITAQPVKTTYTAGETLDLTGLKVTGTFTDGTASLVNDYVATPANGTVLTEEDTQVTVTAQGKTVTVPITVLPQAGTVEKIEVTAQPVKTNYYAGEKFDKTGMVVTATYKNGTSKPVTAYTVTPGILTEETTEVTLEYDGQTAKVPVTVEKLLIIGMEVTKSPDKLAYKAGEVFDPSGMVISVIYNSGEKVQSVDYTYAPNRVLNADDTEMTITYTGKFETTDSLAPVTVPITVTALDSGESTDEITVKFTLYGDNKHGNTEPKHLMKDHNLQLWLDTSVTVPKNSNVIDVMAKALSLAGIPYNNRGGNYIVSIRGLEEMDNGPSSGWMYTLNGTYPELGVAEQSVSNGDKIVFHYTDDFKNEEGSDKWGASGEEEKPTVSVDVPSKVTDGAATSTVSKSDVDKLISEAKKNDASVIDINVKGADKADKVTTELPKQSVSDVAGKTDAVLNINTPAGTVSMDKKAMDEVVKAAEGTTIQIVVEKVKPLPALQETLGTDITLTEVTILSNGKEITTFGTAKLKLNLIVSNELKDKALAAAYVDENGKLEKMAGKKVTVDGKTFYRIETPHLSQFVVAEESVINAAIAAQNGETDEVKLAKVIAGIEKTNIKLRTTKASKGSIKMAWTKEKGYKVDYYEVFRSTKRYSGFTKKPIFVKNTSKLSSTYQNTKKLKSGVRYYYKVRGVRVIDGKKYYTQWSNKAWRTAK